LKICVLTTVHNPDDNRVFHKQVISLRDLGHEVVYVAPGVEAGERDKIRYVNYKKPSSKLKRMLDFYNVYKLVRGLGCEVCHFHDVELLPVGLLLKRHTKIKVVYDVHEDYRNQMLNKYYLGTFLRKVLYRFIVLLEEKADKKFDFIVTADDGTKKYFSDNKSEIVYNFPKLSNYSHINLESEKEYDLVFIGSASKFITDIMLECTAKLKKDGYPVKTLMVKLLHFANSYDYVANRMSELGLDDNDFILIDRLSTREVPDYLTKSKIGVIPLEDLPKYANNIPTKLFEDMICSLPVIASDLAPARHFIGGTDAGFLIKADDVDGYVEKIKLLLDDEELRTRMGQAGRTLVLERYNWENEERKLASIYEALGSK